MQNNSVLSPFYFCQPGKGLSVFILFCIKVNEKLPTGTYEITISVNQFFYSLISGRIYYYTLAAVNFIVTKKLILLK